MSLITLFRLYLSTLLVFLSCGKDQQSNIHEFENAGTIIMVGFRGTTLNLEDPLISDIIEFKVGGVILFDYDVPSKVYKRNIESREQVNHLITQLKNESSSELLFAIDQEGGKVNRLKSNLGFVMMPSAQKIAESHDIKYADSLYTIQAAELSELGFNVNFAPVVDLNLNPRNPIIGSLERSYSSSVDTVIKYSESAIEAYKRHQVLPVLKHFPGHGSSEKDSHLGVVDVSQSWNETELMPFEKLVNKYPDIGVMTAHIYNENLDSKWPATLSESVINGLLREEIGFSGLVFSDDLQMEAIRKQYDLKTTIRQALLAGVDVLVFANNSVYDEQIVRKSYKIIVDLMNEDERIRKQVLSAQNKLAKLSEHLEKTN